MLLFLAFVAIGGFVNMAVLTVVAWRESVPAYDVAWVDDRAFMARNAR